jgi:Flp pilus assembly protein CpaB
MLGLIAVLLAIGAAVIPIIGIRSAVRPIQVVEAVTQVPPMTEVPASALTVRSVPKGGLHQQYFGSPGAVVGHYTLYGLYPGEIISPYDIAPYAPTTSPYAAQLTQMQVQAKQLVQQDVRRLQKVLPVWQPAPPGGAEPALPAGAPAQAQAAYAALKAAIANEAVTERLQAVTLAVTEQQGFAIVHPGDHVMIYGTVADQQHDETAYVVANDVQVLGDLGTGVNGQLNGAVSGTLVLALTPGDVERLMLAQQAGAVQVVLLPLGATPMTVGTVSSQALLVGQTSAQHQTYPTIQSAAQPGAVVPEGGAAHGR